MKNHPTRTHAFRHHLESPEGAKLLRLYLGPKGPLHWIALCGRQIQTPSAPSDNPSCHTCLKKLRRKAEFPG